MKLIDLLVQELPFWPEGATELCWHGKHEGYAYFYGVGGGEFGSPVHIPQSITYEGDANGFDITREQYEAALASLQPPMWNGEGIPPVGSIVDVLMWRGCVNDSDHEWDAEKVLGLDGDVIIVASGQRCGDYDGIKPHSYRKIRTEEERKRHETLYALEMLDIDSDVTIRVLDAIAAGTIPHISLK